MTFEDFYEIMARGKFSNIAGCKALMGLKIIELYIDGAGIEAAGHDIIYGVDAERLFDAGITEAHAIELSELGWFIDDDGESMAHFV